MVRTVGIGLVGRCILFEAPSLVNHLSKVHVLINASGNIRIVLKELLRSYSVVPSVLNHHIVMTFKGL